MQMHRENGGGRKKGAQNQWQKNITIGGSGGGRDNGGEYDDDKGMKWCLGTRAVTIN